MHWYTNGTSATCWQKKLFWWSLHPPPPKKPKKNEWKVFYLIAPFNQAFLIRLQCLLDGAVRRPSTGADAHLSSHVVLSRLRSVWRCACALIYSAFCPSPPPLSKTSSPSPPWLTLRKKKKKKKKVSRCQLTSLRSFNGTWSHMSLPWVSTSGVV